MPTLEEKRARAKRMGIPMPVTDAPLSEGATTAIPVTQANASMHEKLKALKSGAKRQDMSKLVHADKTAAGGFQGIPEPKMRKNPNHPSNNLSDPKFAVNPDAGVPAAKSSSNPELNAIEAMFGGSGGGSYATPNFNPQATQTSQPNLTVQEDGYGPEFNPSAMLADKRSKMKNDNNYMQYALDSSVDQMSEAMGNQMAGQTQFDINNMKRMMKEIAMDTISDVLDSYTNNKGKGIYESYGKTKKGEQIVKDDQGRYYKLVPVNLK